MRTSQTIKVSSSDFPNDTYTGYLLIELSNFLNMDLSSGDNNSERVNWFVNWFKKHSQDDGYITQKVFYESINEEVNIIFLYCNT